MRVIIYGHSDDIVYVDGDISMELYADSKDEVILQLDDALIIIVKYKGIWEFTIRSAYEVEMPEYHGYQIGFCEESPNDYSLCLSIERDEDFTITHINHYVQ